MAESRGKHVTSTWRRGDVAKRERNPNRINPYPGDPLPWGDPARTGIREVLLYFPAATFRLALAQVRAAGKRGGTFRLANAAAGDAVLLGRVQPIAEGHAAQTFRQPGALCKWRQACLPAYVNASKGSS